MPARASGSRCDDEIRRHKPLFENRTLSRLSSVCEGRSLGSRSKAICVPNADAGPVGSQLIFGISEDGPIAGLPITVNAEMHALLRISCDQSHMASVCRKGTSN